MPLVPYYTLKVFWYDPETKSVVKTLTRVGVSKTLKRCISVCFPGFLGEDKKPNKKMKRGHGDDGGGENGCADNDCEAFDKCVGTQRKNQKMLQEKVDHRHHQERYVFRKLHLIPYSPVCNNQGGGAGTKIYA